MYIHRRGHNFQAKGAVGILDEVVEADKINKAISKWFDIAGVRHIDASPSNCDSNTDLRYGVNIANSNNATLFFSIHLNKAYSSYNGAIGSEVCVHSNLPEADRVLSKLQALGLRNRGQKIRKDLYELNMTNMKAMIIEVCFCEATEDVAIYRRVGADGIAKAIVEGILGRSIDKEPATISRAYVEGKTITGNEILLKADGKADLYEYWLQRSNGEWIKLTDYIANSSIKHTFITPDKYKLSVHVKNNGSSKDYDSLAYYNFEVKNTEYSKIDSFEVIGTIAVNSPLVFKTIASSNSEYKYWIYDYESDSWAKMVEYGDYYEFKHTFARNNKYKVVVHVRNKYSTKDYDDRGEIELDFTKENHSNCEHKIDELNGKIKTLEEINKELQKKLEDIKNIVK